jgi:hypothetical protein
MPMFIAILSWIILGDRPSIYRASGLIALLLGLLMMGRGGFWKVLLVLGRAIYFFFVGPFFGLLSVSLFAVGILMP